MSRDHIKIIFNNKLLICFGIFGCTEDKKCTTVLPLTYEIYYKIALTKADGFHHGSYGQAYVSIVSQALDSFVSQNNVTRTVQYITIGV